MPTYNLSHRIKFKLYLKNLEFSNNVNRNFKIFTLNLRLIE